MLGQCDLLCSKEELREKGKWPTLFCLEEGLWEGEIRGKETREKALRSMPGRKKWSVGFCAWAQEGALLLITHVTSKAINLSFTMGSNGGSNNNIVWPPFRVRRVPTPNLVWNWCAQQEGINRFATYMMRFIGKSRQAPRKVWKWLERAGKGK